ncbi:hypothetical protein [Chlorobaculum limnaeum]|uniref:hypothetical protein n=1 Tax=Chlorobaculum limnaeum TaxID=274537 RepID=UPI0012EDC6D0|nr:hypothetical protein [Chlorobaculum limnaeum]
MNQVPPLRLTPDGAQLLANRELLRRAEGLSEIYASKKFILVNSRCATSLTSCEG